MRSTHTALIAETPPPFLKRPGPSQKYWPSRGFHLQTSYHAYPSPHVDAFTDMLPHPFFATLSYTPAQNASPFADESFSTRTRTRTLYVTSGS